MAVSLADWLALREPSDFAARSAALVQKVASRVDADAGPVRVVDLGTGTASNVRYLIDRLPPLQEWLIVDRDPVLLGEAIARMRAWASDRGYTCRGRSGSVTIDTVEGECRIDTRELDLGTLRDPGMFEGRQLVTASALLDLVSAEWLRALAAHCRANRAAALFALTYNGESHCVPAEPEDDEIRRLLNQHQGRDKGFGTAAGPDATDAAARAFEDVGYTVVRERTNWVLAPDAAKLQRELVLGWAAAAGELVPREIPRINAWLARRMEHLDCGRSTIVVGHEDLAAWPAAR